MAMRFVARRHDNRAGVRDLCNGVFDQSEFKRIGEIVGEINRQKARPDPREERLWVVIP
jgi:hypothetical protein